MEVLSILVSFLLDQGAETVRERLRGGAKSWASEVRDRLAALAALRLTEQEADATERWLSRNDVVAALVDGDGRSAEEVARRVAAALAFELGPPGEGAAGERAEQIAVATVVHLLEVVDPATAAALSVHKTLRVASSTLHSGQAELYVVLLDILDRLSEPGESEPADPSPGRAARQHRVMHRAPAPPPQAVMRHDVFAVAKQKLLGPHTGRNPLLALSGAPGYGKTTLALQLCSDADVRAAFADGVLWVTLAAGETQSDLLDHLCDVYTRVTDSPAAVRTVEQASLRLGDALADARHLIVVDNVWFQWQLEPWLRASESAGGCLYTTRDRAITPALADLVELGPMPSEELTAVVTTGLPEPAAAPPELVTSLAGWPLLASLVNGFLVAEARAGAPLLDAFDVAARMLRAGGPGALDADRATSTVIQELSTLVEQAAGNRWQAPAHELLGSLGMFPREVAVPLPVVVDLWRQLGGLSSDDVAYLVRRLADMNLIRRSVAQGGSSMVVHDVIQQTLRRTHAHRLAYWNKALIEAWMHDLVEGGPDWADQPADEPYRWSRLFHHLDGAGMTEQMASLALDPRFIAGQTVVSGAYQVEHDLAAAARVAGPHESVEIERIRSRWSQIAHLAERLPDRADVEELLTTYVAYDLPSSGTSHRPRSDGYRHLWQPPDLPNDHLVRTYVVGPPSCAIAVPPKGDEFYVAVGRHQIDTWSFATGSRLSRAVTATLELTPPEVGPASSAEMDRVAELLAEQRSTTARPSLHVSPAGDEVLLHVAGSTELWNAAAATATPIPARGRVRGVDWRHRRLWCEADSNIVGFDFRGDVTTSIEVPRSLFSSLAGVALGELVTAVVTPSGETHLVDASTGEVTWTVEEDGDDEESRGIAFSQDGTRLFVGRSTGPGRELDVSTGQVLASLDPAAEDIVAGPQGLVAYSYGYRSVRVLGPDRRKLLDIGGFPATITALEFSPDGNVLVVGGFGGYLVAVRVEDGDEVFSAAEHNALIWSIGFREDGTLFSVGADGCVRTWTMTTGTELDAAARTKMAPIDAGWTASRDELLYIGADGSVQRASPEANWEPRPIGARLPIALLAGPQIAAGGRDRAIFGCSGGSLWSIDRDRVVVTEPVADVYFSQLEVASDGAAVYTVSSDDRVCAWDPTLELLWECPAHNMGISSPTTSARIRATATELYCLGLDGVLRTYDARDGSPNAEVTLLSGAISIGDGLVGTRLRLEVAQHPGAIVVVAAGMGAAAVVLDQDGDSHRGPGHDGGCLAAAWNHATGCCVSGGEDGRVHAWGMDGEVIWSYAKDSPVAFVAVSSAASRVAVGCHDGSVGVLEAASGACLRTVGVNSPTLDGEWSRRGEALLVHGLRGPYALIRQADPAAGEQ